MAPVLTEARHPGEFILSEGNRNISRENLLIGASQTILAGTVLGAAVVPGGVTASAVPAAGNTGNGVLTPASPPVSAKAKDGDYILTCTAASSNAGTFSVQTPDGREIGPMTVGVAFNKEIKFTLADGSTDFVVGDSIIFRVGVENTEDLSFGALDLAATDGKAEAAAIAIYPAVTGVGESAKISGIVRQAEVNGKCLEWPAGITAAQKAAAIEQLDRKGIIVR